MSYPSFFVDIMSWRIVSVEESHKLNYKLNHIGVLTKDETLWISLDEIDTLIISDLKCNISVRLIKEIMEKGINVIICDSRHTPIGSIITLTNNSRMAKNNLFQTEWSRSKKYELWKLIVQYKIIMQRAVLIKVGKLSKIGILDKYIVEVEDGDITNREGLAAKVYFRELFGSNFNRVNNDIINSSLNYAYQIVRSKIAQEIVARGYIPSIGLFHCNEYNDFNFADDIIEVFRPLCDIYVHSILEKYSPLYMTPSIKAKISAILIQRVEINGAKQKIMYAIRIFTDSIISYMNDLSTTMYFPGMIENEK